MDSSIFSGTFILVALVFVAFYLFCMWKIYEKAGQPGWSAIVPVYNYYIMTKIIGKPWWWLLLMIIPYIGIIWAIWAVNLLSKSFGKGVGFTLGLIFLGFIFLPIMAFDKSIQYQGPAGNPAGAVGIGDQIQSIGAEIK